MKPLPPSNPPAFHVGTVPVQGRLILAPMDGLSDLPFRSLCREFGSAMSYTSFVAAGAVLNRPPGSIRAFDFLPRERPVVFQIFDDDEVRLLEAARRLMELEPDILDVNMGCSSRCVAGRGAGAGLLREPAKVGRIIGSLRRSLPVPVTAKIRLGWDDGARNFLDVARAIEDHGGCLIAVHGRTKAQAYSGKADWDAIGEIKAALRIPVVGNGDVASHVDALMRMEASGCDAVMIGRAAIGNPWVFQSDAGSGSARRARLAVVLRHLAHMLAYYGSERGVVLFRKHLARYLDRFEVDSEMRRAILVETDAATVRALLEAAIPGDGPQPLEATREAIILGQ